MGLPEVIRKQQLESFFESNSDTVQVLQFSIVRIIEISQKIKVSPEDIFKYLLEAYKDRTMCF